MIRGSARGSVVLMVGQVITAVISALTMIWIARTLGSTAYGEYTIALIPVSIALLFQDLGMNMSLTHYCAIYNHESRRSELKTVVMTGLLFSIFTALVISGLMYAFADAIASMFLNRPEIAPLVRAASFAVLGGGGLVTTLQAIFVGYEMMSFRSSLQILWTVIRAVFSYALILSGLGAFGAVLANTSAQVVAGIIGLFLLIFFIKFEPNSKGTFNFEVLKTFLSYGLPLSASALLRGVLNQIYSYIMILYVAINLIGNYGAASQFGVLVSFLTIPISTTLFPLFSKFKKGDPQLNAIYQIAVKYTAMITLPVVLVIIAVATPLSRVLYGVEDYPYVPLYLSLFILNYAWEGLGGLSLGNLISGVGESRVSFFAGIISFFTGIILAYILVPMYGMVGLLITVVLDSRGGWIYQTLWSKRELGIMLDWDSTVRIYLTGFVAFIPAFLSVTMLTSKWVALGVGGLIYMIVYVVGLPLSGAFKKSDLKQLGVITDSLGPLAPIANLVLSIMGRLARS
jgi:O-antigen/teichoic acid export membrane protein